MKKSLLFLTALVLSLGVQAQFVTKQAEPGVLQRNPATASTALPASHRATLADNQLLMGGYSTDDVATSGEGLGVGSYATGTLRAAIYLPISEVSAFDGGKVVRMRVGLANATSVSRVFITPIINGYIQNDILSQEVKANAAGWSEFDLKEAVDLNFSGYDALLLGYDYNQVSSGDAAYPISCVAVGDPHGLYIYGNLGSGEGYYSFGDSYGNLSVQAVVEKEFEQYQADALPIGDFAVPLGTGGTANLGVKNLGKAVITSIDYTLTIDGQTTTGTASLGGVAFGSVGYAAITFPSADTEKTQRYELTIAKVNGEPNTSTNNTVSGLVASTTKSFQQRVAVEEFTGTGCQWCPRGMVGMEMLRHAYGDKFVGIAIHQYNSSDPMFIPYNNYADLGFTGAPSCAVNRMGIVDPYYGDSNDDFGISQLFDYLTAQPTYADVSVEAAWNDDQTKVTASAVVDGAIEGATYGVEFVLVGDSLSGSTSAWRQTNAYYQYTAAQVGDDLAIFAKGGKYGTSYVTGYKYNDVALSSSYASGVNQIEPVTIGTEPATVSYELSLPTATTLKNAIVKDQVFVAVLLVNTVDGTIVNAAKVHVTGAGETAIAKTISDATATPQARYSLDGRRLQGGQKGLNIIRMTDGTVRKVVVR